MLAQHHEVGVCGCASVGLRWVSVGCGCATGRRSRGLWWGCGVGCGVGCGCASVCYRPTKSGVVAWAVVWVVAWAVVWVVEGAAGVLQADEVGCCGVLQLVSVELTIGTNQHGSSFVLVRQGTEDDSNQLAISTNQRG
eukprot:3289409-Rhodomonas_salina.1